MAHSKDMPLRLVLLGKTGVGKSATGNTILGENVFKSDTSATSVTSRCTERTKDIYGQPVTIIDTPGLYDTSMGNDSVVKETVRGVQMAAPGPHVFLLVISLKRFTPEEQRTVKNIQEIFGPDSNNHMIVLFTNGDDLEFDNKPITTYLNEAGPNLQRVIAGCGGRYVMFNNRKTDNRTQVQTLLQEINRMLNCNSYSYYSYELFTMAMTIKQLSAIEKGKKIADFEQKVRDLERQKKIAELEQKVHDLQRQNEDQCTIL